MEVLTMSKTFKITKAMKSKDKLLATDAYIDAGLPIFLVWGTSDGICLCGDPDCNSPGKHPIYSGGHTSATLDKELIAQQLKEHPDANIATSLKANLAVLDIDGKKGKKSLKSLGLKADTHRVITSNGYHLYFSGVLDFKNSLFSGIDARGQDQKGYVILPPSVHASGHRYSWKLADKIQELPLEITEKTKSRILSVDFEGCEKAIAKGERNERLFRAACALRRQSLPSKWCLRALLSLNKLCEDPLSQKEVKSILKSASRYDEDADADFRCMSEIETQSVKWFWYPYMPRGCIVFLDGHPGRGKSYFTMWLAALCSKGGPFPFSDEVLPKGRVLILNAEDDPERTMRPRLEKAGADLSAGNIHFQGRFKPLTQDGIQTLEAKIIDFKPDLIIIDPLLTYMGSNVDAHRFNEVTEFLTYIDELAREHSATVIGIRHMTKSGGEHAINKGLGSIGFAARARSVNHIGVSKDDPDILGFAHVKSNWSERGATLLFQLVGGSKTEYPHMEWVRVADYPAEDLDPINSVGRPKAASNLKEIFLELLEDTPMGSAAIKRAVSARGINVSDSTIIRELKLVADTEGKGPKAVWRLR